MTPSSAPCTHCVADTPPQAVNPLYPAPALVPANFQQAWWLPYEEASPDQLYQMLVLAREKLQASYPFLEEWQLAEALEDLRLPLRLYAGEVIIHLDGFTTLVQHLAAHYPTMPVAAQDESLAPEQQIKQTHAIRVSLVQQLKRVSYWKRETQAWLLNQALAQLLRQYPEALMPLPEE